MFFDLFFHVVCKISNFNNVNRKAFGTSFLYWVDFMYNDFGKYKSFRFGSPYSDYVCYFVLIITKCCSIYVIIFTLIFQMPIAS